MAEELFWKTLSERIAEARGINFFAKHQSIAGGDINRAYHVSYLEREFFVKINEAPLVSMFETEAEGLRQIGDTHTIRVPEPICHGVIGNKSYLVLEWLDLQSDRDSDWTLMGENLANLHLEDVGDTYGWDKDNFIGRTPQDNSEDEDWTRFFIERRLKPQAELAASKGAELPDFEKLLEVVPEIIGDGPEKPSLVHGDCWSKNMSFTVSGDPVIFDVACYRGDPEVDVAFSELFGRLPQAFYQSYDHTLKIRPGYPRRRELYNLYHILNHYNLFGGHYLEQAKKMMRWLVK